MWLAAGLATFERPAELAQHAATLVHVHAFADQRRPVAVSAALAARGEFIDAPAEQREFKGRHVTNRGLHAERISRRRARFLPSIASIEKVSSPYKTLNAIFDLRAMITEPS